jgi:hypothetical protein
MRPSTFPETTRGFSLYPEAIGEGAAIRLYDRIGGGIIARAVNLPLIV